MCGLRREGHEPAGPREWPGEAAHGGMKELQGVFPEATRLRESGPRLCRKVGTRGPLSGG